MHPLPSWSAESNPVELVWWSLHEALSRNHECAGLDDLVEFAEGYLKERQPFRLKLGEVSTTIRRGRRLEIGRVSIYLVELSSWSDALYTMASTVASTVVGGLISLGVSLYFSRKASEELRREAARLRQLVTVLALYLQKDGLIEGVVGSTGERLRSAPV